jgi:hypothetical protein
VKIRKLFSSLIVFSSTFNLQPQPFSFLPHKIPPSSG